MRACIIIILLGGCVADLEDPGPGDIAEASDPIWTTNGWLPTRAWSTEVPPLGWRPNSLATNPLALPMLARYPLATATFAGGSPYLTDQMNDPDSPAFMSYLVGCALGPDQSVSWNGITWKGAMGLCPMWNTLPAGESIPLGCQEAVSACLIGKNNAFGTRVNISMLGQPANLPARDTPVRAIQEGVQSFQPCPWAQSGLGRTCGWQPEYVGACVPGQPVSVAMGVAPGCAGPPLGGSSGDTMLRVCAGRSGCDTGALAASDDSCGTLYPSVSFTCPDVGFYSVMTAPYSSWSGATGSPGATSEYPAAESWGIPGDAFTSTGGRVPATTACATATNGVTRECGWTTDFIGTCEAGRVYEIGMGGRPGVYPSCGASLGITLGGAGTSSDGMLRVCDGMVACNNSAALARLDDSCGTYAPYGTFVCPTSNTFNVMKAAWNSQYQPSGRVEVRALSGGASAYAASESEVFTWREGAFYGNIFDGQLAAGVDVHWGGPGGAVGKGFVITGSIYQHMYACWSEGWSFGEALLQNRVCSGARSGNPLAPHQNCLATPVGACGDYYDHSFTRNLCAEQNGVDGEYELCNDVPTRQWSHPITVYLNNRCQLLATGDRSCASL